MSITGKWQLSTIGTVTLQLTRAAVPTKAEYYHIRTQRKRPYSGQLRTGRSYKLRRSPSSSRLLKSPVIVEVHMTPTVNTNTIPIIVKLGSLVGLTVPSTAAYTDSLI